MNRGQLIKAVANVLQENDIRKPVSMRKSTLHITDDDGHTANFTIKHGYKTVAYTKEDVAAVIDACVEVALATVQRGEPVSIQGFGSIYLRHRAARKTRKFGSSDWVDIEERWIPKFTFGNRLRAAARVYELTLKDNVPEPDFSCYDDPEEEEEA